MNDPHLIRRHGAFFRPNAHGYTVHLGGAGLFPAEKARRYLDVEGLTIHPVGQYLERAKHRRAELLKELDGLDAIIAAARAQQPAPRRHYLPRFLAALAGARS